VIRIHKWNYGIKKIPAMKAGIFFIISVINI
jgi:hypothetical protein